MSRGKVSAEARLAAAKACAEGRMSQCEAARRIGVNRSNVREWTALYKEKGAAAFEKADRNPEYSAETKLQAVKEYLGGKGSLKIIEAKYGLHAKSTLLGWIKVYNSDGDFRRRGSGGSRMTTGRKTTQEERIAIAKECLENECNYRAKARRSRRADRPDHNPPQEDRALHRDREGPAGAHHRVRRESVGFAGRQHDSVRQGPDRLPADLRGGD